MAVTPAMIAVALGVAAPESGSATEAQWQMWIDDAAMLIEDRRTTLVVDPIDEAKVDYVVRNVVVAKAQRPQDGVSQVTTSVDDGSVSRTYRSASKDLSALLEDWWAFLGLVSAGGAFSLELTPADSSHLPWCSLSMGALYCSCGADIAGYPIYELDA